MKILTKLMLASAVMVTSGFASDISGGIEVAGTHNQNENASVAGLIEVKSGGTFNNAAKLTFGTGGGIETAAAVEAKVEDYEAANDSLQDDQKVPAVGTYPPGSIVANFVSGAPDSMDHVANWKGLDNGDFELNSDGFVNTVTFEAEPQNLPTSFDWSWTHPDETRDCSISWNYESSKETWAPGELQGIVDADEFKYINYEFDWGDWRVNGNVISNTQSVSKQDIEDNGLPESTQVNLGGGDRDSGTLIVSWTYTPQSEEKFIEEVKAIVGDLSKPAGVFNNADGHLELTAATGKNFSGQVDNGDVTLRHDTAATLTSLKVVDITANYTYESGEKFEAPAVDENKYITVAYTAAKSDTDAQTECLGKFAADSTITTFNGTAVSDGSYDNRLTFPGILADGELNLTANKLATNHIPTAIKEYVAANGLDVDAVINIQFDGSDNLMFANGGDEKVIEFAGVNSRYSGVASFAAGVEKVVANGDNTLPQKLTSNMNDITVEISGENTINNGGSTTIKSLKVNTGAKLIVAAGTTLTVGGAI